MQENITSLIQQNVDLAPYNTLGVNAKARYFIEITSQRELLELVNSGLLQTSDYFVLGGGSNILFLGDFDGYIIHNAIKGREVIRDTGDDIYYKIGAGENWHETVRHCVEMGWGGIENLSLIPGTVGAAPIQNIGAYGVELKEIFKSLSAVHLETGHIKMFEKKECRFGYRNSIFKRELKGKYIITHVTLRLSKIPKLETSYGAIQSKLDEKGIKKPTIRDLSDIVIEIRQSKLPDPAELGNAGSFFKNPVISRPVFESLQDDYPDLPGYPMGRKKIKVPAGWLIEKTGWKGKVVGNVGTYDQQSLVLVNHGGATGHEIWSLAEKIRESVKDTFDIELVPEVNIIGS